MIKRYRQKGIFEALQVQTDNRSEIEKFCDPDDIEIIDDDDGVMVKVLHNVYPEHDEETEASIGDWITKRVSSGQLTMYEKRHFKAVFEEIGGGEE